MKKVIVMLAVLAIAAPVMAFHPTEKCNRCHVPHNAVELDGMPLWAGSDHQFDPADGYTAYQGSSKMDSSPDDGTDLSGSTIVCLSCHDSVAGGHYPAVNADEDVMGGAVAVVAGNLAESHPIEMVYDIGLATTDGELYNPATNGGGIVIGGRGTIQLDMLEADRVTCISCHEVHANGLHEGLTTPTEEEGSYEREEMNDNGTPDDDTDDFLETVTYPVPAGTTYEIDFPHLVNVENIRWALVRRGNESDPEEYELVYGALCLTCHQK